MQEEGILDSGEHASVDVVSERILAASCLMMLVAAMQPFEVLRSTVSLQKSVWSSFMVTEIYGRASWRTRL